MNFAWPRTDMCTDMCTRPVQSVKRPFMLPAMAWARLRLTATVGVVLRGVGMVCVFVHVLQAELILLIALIGFLCWLQAKVSFTFLSLTG